MQLFPAIDIRGGKAVRLTQGDFTKTEVYSDSPAETALSFKKAGAENLHVVDLDGAKNGSLSSFDTIRQIAETAGLFIQVGGGIRDEGRVFKYLELGVGRVILGTAAAENFDFAADMLKKYGDKIAVGVDARDGKVAVRGWLESTELNSFDFCKRLSEVGVSVIIYTDIARDGAMSGTNMDAYESLLGIISCRIIASGGISCLNELEKLKNMGVYGAILGKSIYTGAIKLEEALALC